MRRPPRLPGCCAGLHVHQATVTACVRLPGKVGQRTRVLQTFGTTTPELLTLWDWHPAHGLTDAAMESTGVYWKPVYSMLEDTLPSLVNVTQSKKNVPGRKADVSEAAWIAWLLVCGLLWEASGCLPRSASSETSRATARLSSRPRSCRAADHPAQGTCGRPAILSESLGQDTRAYLPLGLNRHDGAR